MIKNIASYAFFKPEFELEAVREALYARMEDFGIKGTILLAQEGFNASLCGEVEKMDEFLSFLFETLRISPPEIKISFSEQMPFKRLKVKIKDYIVVDPGGTLIDPIQDTAPYLSPEELHQWIMENKRMVLLDTRNDYEYDAGRFTNSMHLGTKHFADFEEDLQKAPHQWRDTPVITFCTGGIRCEKAAPLMLKKGFQQVYQLDGGILNYFKKIGRGYFEGECFVFDERRTVDEGLNAKEMEIAQ